MGNIVHVIVSIFGAGLLAVPFWAFWTVSGFGSTNFKFLPTEWQEIGLADCACLLITVAIMRSIIFPKSASFIPTHVVPQTANGHARQNPLLIGKLVKGNRLGDKRSIFSTKLQPGPSVNNGSSSAIGEARENASDDKAVDNVPGDLRELSNLWAKLSGETRTACLALARDSVVKLG